MAGFPCPHCGRHLSLPGLVPGQRVACGFCRRVVTVPGTGAPGVAGGAPPPLPMAPPPGRSNLLDDDLIGPPASEGGTAPWERGTPMPPPPPSGGFGADADPSAWVPADSYDTAPASRSGARWGDTAENWDRGSRDDALKQVSGLNYAPLILGGFWAFGNNLYLWGILGMIPCLGLGGLVNLYLFYKGNELSWKTGKWRSVRVFKETQRMWLWIALILGGILGIGAVIALGFYAKMLSDVMNDPIFTQ